MGRSNEEGRGSEEGKEIAYTIDEYKALAMGLFNVSLSEAGRMTLYEFKMNQIALEIKEQQNRKQMAIQSWFNQRAKAQKNIGSNKKPKVVSLYKNFDDFYDGHKDFKNIFIPESKVLSLADRNRLLNQKKGG